MCQNWCAGSGHFTPNLTMTEGPGYCNYRSAVAMGQNPTLTYPDTQGYDTFHWQFQNPNTITCAYTTDQVCGGKSSNTTGMTGSRVASQNHCDVIVAKASGCSFNMALFPTSSQSTTLAAAQCCYQSMADDLFLAHT